MTLKEFEDAGLRLLQDDERFHDWCEQLRSYLADHRWEESGRWKQVMSLVATIHARTVKEASSV